MKTALMAGITVGISLLVQQINKWIHAQEEARQKATELTNAYKEQQSSLEDQIKKYKELKETLDKGNLSTDETRSIKEQLLEIQQSLIESYGNEASNIDLVNGKYREQLGLLEDLSKEKASNYIVENKAAFEDAKKELEKIRTYQIGSIFEYNVRDGKSDAQKQLYEYVKSYSDLFELRDIVQPTMGEDVYAPTLYVIANAEDAKDVIDKFYYDIEQYIEDNNLQFDFNQIHVDLSKISTDINLNEKLNEYREIYDEFMKAEIVCNDTLRPLYQQSIQAVEDYNKALSSSEGIEEAKANLNSLQLSVQEATKELEGSQEIFDDIYEGINKNAEAAYNLNQAFENDDTVKQYAEQLRGLLDTDLKAINFDNDILEKGEEAFRGLIETLGLTEDQAQTVINKLVELGYVYGSVVNAGSSIDSSTFDITTHKDSIDDFQSKLKTLGNTLSSIRSGNFEDSDLTDLLQEFPELADKTDDLETAIVELINNALQALYDTLGEDIPDSLKTSLQDLADIASGTAKHLSDAFSDIHDSWDILHDFKDTMDKGFDSHVTDSLLQSVRKLSGELETLVAGYYSGVVSAEQLYEVLTQHYKNDLNNYSEALIKKNELNEDFYNAVGLASEEVTNQFMDDYDVDIKNCTTYNQAKLEIEKQTLGKISAMWSQYYDAQSKTLKLSMSEIEARATHGGGDAKAFLEQYELIENYEAAIEALNNITYDGIRSNFEGIGSKLSANSGSSSSSSTKSEFEETVDFFERRVDVLSDALSLLETNLDNVTGAFAKNNLIDAELGLTEEKFKNYSDALNMYTQKANEALSKLPSDIAQKIRNGAVALTDFIGDGNKDVVDAIKDYESWADKIADCKEELAELKTAIRQLELEKFNNIVENFTNAFDLRENGKDLISKQIDLLKEAGELIGESFFTAQIDQSKKQLALLEEEKAQLVNQMTSALSSGRITQGTSEWLEMVDALSGIDGEILNCKKSIESLDNSLLELHTEIFYRIQDQFSNLDSEISNIIGLFEDFDVADDKGIWSKEGLAQLGLLTQEYELAQYQIQQYNNEINELNRLYLEGRYSATEFSERLATLSEQQWQSVKSAESAKDAIMDLNKARVDLQIDGIEKEIDAYEKLTNQAIANLKAEKDLYDWKNKLKDLNKSITDIEKQLSALEYDTSQSAIAKKKKLQQDLVDATETLNDEMYQHSIETSEDALNQQYEDFKSSKEAEIEALKDSLNNQELLIAESFEAVKNNADLIGQEIASIALEHGITVSDSLISSWQSGENAIASYGEVLSQNTSTFIGNIMQVENETWNLQAQANSTADTLAYMFSTRADNLVNELAQSYYAEGNLNVMTQTLHDSLVNTLEGGYDISSITNALSSIANGVNSITAAANNASQALANLGAIRDTGDVETTVTTKSTSSGSGHTNSGLFNETKRPQVSLAHYASGVRHLPNDEIAITQDDGTEIILSPVRGGVLLPKEAFLNKEGAPTELKKGDTVLTNEQTDNMFKWSQFNPEEFRKALNIIPQNIMPDIPKVEPRSVNNTIQIDNVLTVQGSIDNGNVKRMEQVAQRAINDAFGRFSNDVNVSR